jgi:hypothetical protein
MQEIIECGQTISFYGVSVHFHVISFQGSTRLASQYSQ